MAENSRDTFHGKLDAAPYVAREYVEGISAHFERKDDMCVHHTDTKGSGLCLAIRREALGQKSYGISPPYTGRQEI